MTSIVPAFNLEPRCLFQVYHAMDVTLCTSSILHLCCISVDRYYAIVDRPLLYNDRVTTSKCAVAVLGCWVLAGIYNIIIKWLFATNAFSRPQQWLYHHDWWTVEKPWVQSVLYLPFYDSLSPTWLQIWHWIVFFVENKRWLHLSFSTPFDRFWGVEKLNLKL